MKKNIYWAILLVLVSMILLVACADDAQEQSSSKSAGSPAMVDGVVVETINQHQYAVVNALGNPTKKDFKGVAYYEISRVL